MGTHLTSKGIVVQCTVPYAHQQNGKSEHYICTIEEGGQALLADAGLPMSFWLDAVLTCQYLVNWLPTSTLPDDTTPFEVISNGCKPDRLIFVCGGVIVMLLSLMNSVPRLVLRGSRLSLLVMRTIR